MGLDMYLKRYPKNKTSEQIQEESDEAWSKSLDEWSKWDEQYSVAYWRKVNFLHGWFIRNLAGGIDECQDIDVGKEDINDLKELVDYACSTILKSTFIPQKCINPEDWDSKYEPDMSKPSLKCDGGKLPEFDDGTVYFVDDEHASRLDVILPPERGFFFGSYDYDAWYAIDMFDLRDTLKRILADWKDDYMYTYSASW